MWFFGIGIIPGIVVGLGALLLKLIDVAGKKISSGSRPLSPIQIKAWRWRKKRKDWIPRDLYQKWEPKTINESDKSINLLVPDNVNGDMCNMKRERDNISDEDLYNAVIENVKNDSGEKRRDNFTEFKYFINYMLTGSLGIERIPCGHYEGKYILVCKKDGGEYLRVEIKDLVEAATISGIFDDIEVDRRYANAYRYFNYVKKGSLPKGWKVRQFAGRDFWLYYD